MEVAKYILAKMKQQNEAVQRAKKLEYEIENWCNLSGVDVWSKEYKETKGRLADSVAPINTEKLLEIISKS